jgi:MFS transporter, ACS family, allantoate permease
MDKTTLGQSAVLGLMCAMHYFRPWFILANFHISPGAHLTQNQFNWLGTAFYLSYLVFEYPQNLALQYLPVGKWMR